MQDPPQTLTIRPASPADVEALDRCLPQADSSGSHAERVRNQDRGDENYWIAWMRDVPVGHVIVRWTGFRFGALPERFPNVPVLSKLLVWPPEHWGRGIGTALVAVAERAASDRGYSAIGLAVVIGNERAQQLYSQLGFVDWGEGALTERIVRLDSDGNEVPYDEVFTIYTKRLWARSPDQAERHEVQHRSTAVDPT